MARRFRPDRTAVHRVIDALDAAAAKDDGYGEWVAGVLPRVGAMVRNGKPLAEIAAVIRGAGLPLSDSTLRRFLRDPPSSEAATGRPRTVADDNRMRMTAADGEGSPLAAADQSKTEGGTNTSDTLAPTAAAMEMTASLSWMDDVHAATTGAAVMDAGGDLSDEEAAAMLARIAERKAESIAKREARAAPDADGQGAGGRE